VVFCDFKNIEAINEIIFYKTKNLLVNSTFWKPMGLFLIN
jgi:hypothetical protein